tara:strand:+ start:503 stop:637 length:135 start_codon:yes stop_codon:yes gene_type:complete
MNAHLFKEKENHKQNKMAVPTSTNNYTGIFSGNRLEELDEKNGP